jgi:Flp pilus assembly pilin Flp
VTAPVGLPRAQGLVEYGLILALTALFTLLILNVFDGVLADVLNLIAEMIEDST